MNEEELLTLGLLRTRFLVTSVIRDAVEMLSRAQDCAITEKTLAR